MADPMETLPGKTEAIPPGIEVTATGIPCAGTKRATKTVTPS